MGYGVYEAGGRWAGYSVPAECDMPECATKITRGLDAKCEEHHDYKYLDGEGVEVGEDGEREQETETENEGCGLFFCSDHAYKPEEHAKAVGKEDSLGWLYWMCHHESWATWRTERADAYQAASKRLADATEDELERGGVPEAKEELAAEADDS